MNTRTNKLILVATTAMVFITGCETLDPYTREEKTSQATKGALIGAAAGAVVESAADAPFFDRSCDLTAVALRVAD